MHKNINTVFLFSLLMVALCLMTGMKASAEEKVPAFTLKAPELERHRSYLGISTEPGGEFSINDIDADVLLIEIFNMYCPYCQAEAYRVNELHQLMDAESVNGIKMKIVGFGASNTKFEVNHFKETFDIQFPLFADKNLALYKKLGAKSTPTFIGCVLHKDGDAEIVLRESGGFNTAEEFLGLLLQRAGYR